MKHCKKLISVLLVFALMLTGFAFSTPSAKATEQTKSAAALFGAKFEGDNVAGTAEFVDGVYRIAATRTDGEAWHIKLESNYPTVTGHEYRVTYHFRSNVAGTVKFGDLQEFRISAGDNQLTGLVIAKDGTSYLDLQLGALGPFTIDFSQIEVVEKQDDESYESVLPGTLELDGEDVIMERHDSEYGPLMMCRSDSVTVNYFPVSHDPAVWKARLYVRTGVTPQPGVRYRVSADLLCDEDMDFEVLLNRDEQEKGYGALYGRHLTGGELTTVEQILMLPESGFADGELVVQFSLGCAPEDVDVTVSNVRVEKVVDKYTNQLPAGFALNKRIFNGKTLTTVTASDQQEVTLTRFSYSGTDTVYEQHDDGYVVNLTEASDSATLSITQAPAEGRGVWKARLYAVTGVTPEAGSTYRIRYDLTSGGNQAEYEACFDGDYENAYGVLYGRSLTAGGTDHVEQIVTPDVSHGPLTLRLQLGNTDSTAGNTFTLKNLSVEKLTPAYQSVGDVAFSTGGDGNVWEEHSDGIEQTVSASGNSASLTVSAERSEGGVWSSRLFVGTGVVPEAGEKYHVKLTINAAKALDDFEIVCDNGGAENGYSDGKRTGLSLPAGADTEYTTEFTAPSDGCEVLTLRFQLGNTPADNTITVSNIQVCKASGGVLTTVELPDFAYPVTTGGESTTVPAGYAEQGISLSLGEAHDEGYEQTLDGNSLTISAVPATGIGVWSSKLFVDTGVTPESGAKYIVTADVGSEKALDFEICYNNGDEEKGYGALYGQSIAAGESKSFVYEFDVAADAAAGKLILQLMVGKSPASNTITVNSVKVEKVIAEHETAETEPAGYQTVALPGLSASAACDDGYAQEISGTTLTISAIPAPETGVWNSKLFVDTGVTPESDAKYKVTVSVSSEKALDFEICFNSGDAEKGYGALYGQSIAAGESKSFVHEFDVAADAAAGKLILQLMVGKSPASNTITVNSVKVEKVIAEHETTVTEPAGYQTVALPGLSASTACDDGYAQELSGTTLTISTVPETDTGVWKSKLFVDTQTVLEAGAKYRVTASMTAARGMDFEICYNNGSAEKGYSALYGQSIGADETRDYVHEFEVSADIAAENLVLQFQLGNSPADNRITVNSVTLEKWMPEQEGTSTIPESTEELPVTLSAWEQHADGFDQSVSGTALTINALPTLELGVWQSKLFADTQFTPESGAKYKVTANLSSAQSMEFEICYNSGSAEKGYGALYGQSIGAGEARDYVYEFEVAADAVTANLVLQFMLGKSPAPNTITVNSVTLEKWMPEQEGTSTVPESTEELPVTLSAWEQHADGFDQSVSGTSLTVSAVPGNGVWQSKLFADTKLTPEAGAKYKVTANLSSSQAIAFEICYNNGAEEKGYGAAYNLSISSGETRDFVYEFDVSSDAARENLVLQIMLGKSPAPNTLTVNSVKVEKWVPEHEEQIGGSTEKNSFDLESNENALAVLTGDGTSATATITTPGDDWHIKFYAKPGIELQAGRTYTITMNVTGASGCAVCYKNTATGSEEGFGTETVGSGTVTHTVTPESNGTLEVLLKLGTLPAGSKVIISDLVIETLDAETLGDNLMTDGLKTAEPGNVNVWAHEDYAAALSCDGSSANLSVLAAPDSGREFWKIKLFVETGITLEAGKHYRIRADVSADKDTDYEICYNNGAEEKGVGALYGLNATAAAQTAEYETTVESAADLILQFNFGLACSSTNFTVSNVTVEEMTDAAAENVLPSFSYDSVGSFSVDAGEGYIVSLAKAESSAALTIHQAPDVRDPWRVKLNVNTGFTPEPGKAYIVSFDVETAKPQSSFEVFYDGTQEAAYGERYDLSLSGKKTVSQIIYPNSGSGVLSLQLRCGKTDGTDGNIFTVSNVKVQSVKLIYNTIPVDEETASLRTEPGYSGALSRKAEQASVRLFSCPKGNQEPWKTKLFIPTGVNLRAGQKYRVSFEVFSNADVPYELCLNRNGQEKGFGARYGMTATYTPQVVEYIFYASEDGYLELQFSLGNANAPCTFTVSGIKVEKAAGTSVVSDTIYQF